jgi:hypothetical protein
VVLDNLSTGFGWAVGTNYPTPDGTCIRDYIHVRCHLPSRRYSTSLGHMVMSPVPVN